MVFCDFGAVFKCIGKYVAVLFRHFYLFFVESSIGSKSNDRKRKREKSSTAVFTIFTSSGSMACNFIRKNRKYRASFTIEAVFVLGVVMVCICGLIGFVYRTHDTVTGKMILEEVLIQARKIENTDAVMERSERYRLEAYGETLGNPRLWLGAYDLDIQIKHDIVKGKASAGDWSQEMEMHTFHPGDTLLKFEALKELEKEWKSDGSGIQEGDEP